MSAFLQHWFMADFWSQVWPNLAASPICAAYVLASHVVRERAAKVRHAEVLASSHCTGCTCGGETP